MGRQMKGKWRKLGYRSTKGIDQGGHVEVDGLVDCWRSPVIGWMVDADRLWLDGLGVMDCRGLEKFSLFL